VLPPESGHRSAMLPMQSFERGFRKEEAVTSGGDNRLAMQSVLTCLGRTTRDLNILLNVDNGLLHSSHECSKPCELESNPIY
jgi:hypothetical protein